MFREFLAFLVAAGLLLNQVTTVTLLTFLEFLADQGLSPSNIVNHMVTIRSQFLLYGLDTSPFRDDRILLFQKSLMYTKAFFPIVTQIHVVFKALYSFCVFFSFLGISNILPHTMASFDITRQLCRGDLIFSPDTITVLMKWSKTLQNRTDTTTICIPALGTSPVSLQSHGFNVKRITWGLK